MNAVELAYSVLGDGLVSVSDCALELLAGFSDLGHGRHPLVLLPQRAHLHRQQRYLWVTPRWVDAVSANLTPTSVCGLLFL